MNVIKNGNSDIRWKHIPSIYFKLENWLIPQFNRLYCVHEKGVANYKARFPSISDRFEFLPTWMNPDIFFYADTHQKLLIRKELKEKYEIPENVKLAVFVGRIDSQKNPLRLINAFRNTLAIHGNAHLLIIGDGVLKQQIQDEAKRIGISHAITFTGIMPNQLVARYLQGSDLLVLSSDYEGMPRCVLEALGCGIPVATTNTGEVGKIVIPGVNGQISKDFSVDGFSDALIDCFTNLDIYKGVPCLNAVKNYIPVSVLKPLFQAYRESVK
ncbi:glycosyltransferase family 4 protein [Methylomonas sp. MgM2]